MFGTGYCIENIPAEKRAIAHVPGSSSSSPHTHSRVRIMRTCTYHEISKTIRLQVVNIPVAPHFCIQLVNGMPDCSVFIFTSAASITAYKACTRVCKSLLEQAATTLGYHVKSQYHLFVDADITSVAPASRTGFYIKHT